ncbi:MAG: DNA mismatch endonuclease Vsr [Candidatus Omnitrophica bacterium]|nr:DNA mismatch endonuclease Vsr [Candidatus Omnitrophota bacterium]
MKKKINNKLGRNFNRKRQEDKITTEKRSSVMSKVRSRGTKFEKDFIEQLKKQVRNKFHVNVKEIRGKPDIVFKRKRICVFLDSNFWHGWQYPRWKHLLKDDFWRKKIEKNRARDRKTTRYLRRNGWAVVRIWEHEIKGIPSKSIEKIKNALRD